MTNRKSAFDAQNDRTMLRRARRITEARDFSGREFARQAFHRWLRDQNRMLACWEAELLANDADDQTLSALQAHRAWMASIA